MAENLEEFLPGVRENGITTGKNITTTGSTTTATLAVTGTSAFTGIATFSASPVFSGGRVPNVISGSGATVTLTAAQAGSLVLMDRAAGIVFTLPAPTVGAAFTFFASASVTTNNYKIITNAGTVFLAGTLCNVKTDLTTLFSIGDNAANLAVTMNGTTTGGLVGTRISFTCTTATQWIVEGYNLASGTIATPFANS